MDASPSRLAGEITARPDSGARDAMRRLALLCEAVLHAESRLLAISPPAWSVFAAVLLVGSIALGVYVHYDLTLVYGDGIGHLYIARRVFDSTTPSFAQLGGIWLPLPHVLMLPLIWIDPLWRTGLAGSLVSLICFALSGLFLYLTVHALTRHGIAAALATALFATNPNMLFMQTTPMGEAVTICFVLGATYFLVRWTQTAALMHLMLSAAFVMMGTLTRYEVWTLVPAGAAIVAITAYSRDRNLRRAEGITIAWGIIAFYGIALWLIYSQVIFGDFLNFARGYGTAQGLVAEKAAQGLIPYRHHPMLATALYGWSVVDTAGLPLVLAGCAGFVGLLISRVPLSVKLAAALPVSIFLFEVFSLTMGQSAMGSPHASPASFDNSRYGLLTLPAVVIMAGVVSRTFRSAGVLLLVAALVPQLLILPDIRNAREVVQRDVKSYDHAELTQLWVEHNRWTLRGDQPILLLDPASAGGFSRPDAEPAKFLKQNVHEGKVLISGARNDGAAIIMRSGLSASRFINETNKPFFGEELGDPGRRTSWIVFQPDVPTDSLRPMMQYGTPGNFQLVFDNGIFQIFKKRTDAEATARPVAVPLEARFVTDDVTLGTFGPTTGPGAAPPFLFASARCDDGLLRIATDRAVIFAEASCVDYWSVAARFSSFERKAVHINFQGAGTPKLFVSADGTGTARINVGRVWYDDPRREGAAQP